MVHFVNGSGSTGSYHSKKTVISREADVVIYAGSLVNPKLLEYTKDICTITAVQMTLEEVILCDQRQKQRGKTTVDFIPEIYRKCMDLRYESRTVVFPSASLPSRSHGSLPPVSFCCVDGADVLCLFRSWVTSDHKQITICFLRYCFLLL